MGRNSRVLILIAGILMIPAMLFAQFNNNTSSPYSRYGLGDLQSYSFGRTAAMGGATLGSRYALQVNNANPASYTATDSLNFLFEFGLKGDFSRYSSEISEMKTSDINFNYFSMSFRINKWMATSIGLTPYSNVGYQIEVNEDIENTGAARTIYYGTGTISDAYLGLAIQPLKNVSLGMNLNYRFGKISRNSELTFEYADLYLLQRYSQLRVTDFGLEFGAQVILPMKDNKQLVLAGVFESKPTYTAFESDIVQKNIYYGGVGDQDTLAIKEEQKGKIVFPTTLGFGLSYSKKNVYELNFDYYHQGWADATIMGEKSEFLSDLNKFAVGAEWIPDKFSIRSAWKRVAYRAGFKYEQTYHSINGHQINDFGISFGLGLPIYRSNSTINISAEFGKRGTTDYNLVRENYAKVNLSANLHDLWFMSRKID
ncbi:hypothetical protein [Maribellus sp. YY47]|uniref:hypothetical protein n=1 Tax=Maribellus sp. YY47 TaxID=2929486 RepID=UPI0020007FB0|nr:hypothetical protein [Maribellus sp. YY47]MCK3682512.1 hypothetical protein [Maribellus sp. YY47]